MHSHEEMHNTMEQRRHAADVQRHEIRRFIHELKEDQLRTFIALLTGFAEEDGPDLANHFQGMATTILEAKFGVCWACVESPCVMTQAVDKMVGIQTLVAAPGSTEPLIPDEVGCKIGESGMLSTLQIDKMEEYNLDDLREEGSNKLLGFICLGCKDMTYSTIGDRMLKPAGKGNCPGCVNKEKFG